jgi:hypothetical protein
MRTSRLPASRSVIAICLTHGGVPTMSPASTRIARRIDRQPEVEQHDRPRV